MRFSPIEIRDKALTALDEAFSASQKGPIPKSAALRLTLAILANHLQDDWALTTFWKVATNPPDDDTHSSAYGRRQSLQNARAMIYGQLGMKAPD